MNEKLLNVLLILDYVKQYSYIYVIKKLINNSGAKHKEKS